MLSENPSLTSRIGFSLPEIPGSCFEIVPQHLPSDSAKDEITRQLSTSDGQAE